MQEIPTNQQKIVEHNPSSIDHFDKSPATKAILKKRSNNAKGSNQYSYEKSLTPYSIRYALAKSVLDQGKTITEAVRYSGLCKETVSRIKHGVIKLADEVVANIKQHESRKLAYLGNHILDSINEKDIEKSSLLQKVTASSILIDKRRLLDNQSTSNVSVISALESMSNMESSHDEILNKLKAITVDNQLDTSAKNNEIIP